MAYVVTRTPQATSIFDDNTPAIELVGTDKNIRPYNIPTSLFREPGDQPFAWSAIGLVGCTLLTMVKERTEADQSSGLYMAHYWE